jgi:hypothetical protein
MSIEKPEVMNQVSHFELTTLFGVNSLIFILYVKFFRPSFEVVKEGRILKKIKNMQIKIAIVFVMCNPLQKLSKIQ